MIKKLFFILFPILIYAQDNADLYPPDSLTIAYHTKWTKNHYKERIAAFKEDPLKFGDIVFIGNSITEGGKNWSEKFNLPNVRNRGISGDVTDGVLKRLGEIIYFKPKAVFLLIGINDLFNLYYQKQIPSAKYVGENILKIAHMIKQKSPSTLVYVQTLLPTDKDFMQNNIDQVNALVKAQHDDDIFQLIDLNKAFSDEQGFLKKELSEDGTHLNKKGYELWITTEKDILKALPVTLKDPRLNPITAIALDQTQPEDSSFSLNQSWRLSYFFEPFPLCFVRY